MVCQQSDPGTAAIMTIGDLNLELDRQAIPMMSCRVCKTNHDVIMPLVHDDNDDKQDDSTP